MSTNWSENSAHHRRRGRHLISPKKRALLSKDADAGIFQDITGRKRKDVVDRFRVNKIKAIVEQKPINLIETPGYLKYETPRFRTAALVTIPPLEPGDVWEVGWVQAVRYLRFVNTYGIQGRSSWEIPELETDTQPMVCDCDGSMYPWYGNSEKELARVIGPTSEKKTVKVYMDDQFTPRVSWSIPVNDDLDLVPYLTHVYRKQGFYTWLVAHNARTGQYIPLKSMSWTVRLEIDVNPKSPVDYRARVVADRTMFPQPVVHQKPLPLSPFALIPPRANCAQMLKWFPHNASPQDVIMPISEDISTKVPPSIHALIETVAEQKRQPKRSNDEGNYRMT